MLVDLVGEMKRHHRVQHRTRAVAAAAVAAAQVAVSGVQVGLVAAQVEATPGDAEARATALMVAGRVIEASLDRVGAAVAADTGSLCSLVTNVVVEAKGQLANNDRPGDIADLVKGKQFSIDVCAA